MKRYCVEAKLRLKQLQCSLDFIQQNYQNNKMGALCCCDLFQKNEIQTNQSRLRLLEMKVQSQHTTENDHHFTYYLHYFEQHAYLEKILLQYRSVNQITQDSSSYQFNSKQLQVQIENLTHYLQDIQNSQSQISKRMRADQAKILQEAQMQSQSGPKEQFCMVKLQIQGFQIVQGITKISIVNSTKIKNQQKNSEEVIVMSRTKNEKIYRELIFPTVKGSKIKIVTAPKSSKITIDVEDIMKNQAVCNVFKLQNNDEDFGYVALRMQYFTVSPLFHKLRNEKMKVLQKELKLCTQGSEGVHRLSSRSHASSHVNTFISDHVSEYPNQYHM